MLHTLFDHNSAVVELENTEKFAAIHEVITRTSVFHDGLDLALFEEAVRRREAVQSTGVGHGVAFAHGKLPQIDRMRVALGVSRRGIPFDSVDGRPVHLLFVVATNPDMHIDYLKCLAKLSSLFRHDAFREEILGCPCHEDMRAKIRAAYGHPGPIAFAS